MAAQIMYGGGLRVGEVFSLRIKDVDFARQVLTVRQAKGNKDRETILAPSVISSLKQQVAQVGILHARDVKHGQANVELPDAFHRKSPASASEFGWYFVFSARRLSRSPYTGRFGRWHLMPDGVQKAISWAAKLAGIHKRVTCHTLRHSFATHALEAGASIEQIRLLLGHEDIKTTEIYLHVTQSPSQSVTSPLERLAANKPLEIHNPQSNDPLRQERAG